MVENTNPEAVSLPEIDNRNERELVELFDALNELREGTRIDPHVWDIEVTSPEGILTEEQCEAVSTAIRHTIGQFRGIIGQDDYIPSGVYWQLVREYTEEVIEALEEDPEWADNDLTIFREIVMPREMSRTYSGDNVANFSVLKNSLHQGTGWTQEYDERYMDAQGMVDKIEGAGWTDVLGTMAYAACVQDVAQKVRDEGYDIDLEHLEYL